MDYKASGVDIDAGNETVRRIRALARSTFTAGVISDIGSFGGLFQLETGRYREPVLVSSADGVGTKLKLAFLTNRHHTIGVDLVNHPADFHRFKEGMSNFLKIRFHKTEKFCVC